MYQSNQSPWARFDALEQPSTSITTVQGSRGRTSGIIPRDPLRVIIITLILLRRSAARTEAKLERPSQHGHACMLQHHEQS